MPTLLFVHPHPDDEAIACGGAIAMHVAAGDDVTVVTCTGGEEGENQSGIDLEGREMADVRREEMTDAVAALGLGSDDHVWLGYRDSGMVGTSANEHADSFHRADLDEAAARLAAIVRARRPQVVVSDDANGTYGHPDHVKANRVTIRAVELAADPQADVPGEPWKVPKRYVHAIPRSGAWELHQRVTAAGAPSPFGEELSGPEDLPFGVPDEALTTRVAVGDHRDAKNAAMLAHRSQIGPDSFFFNLPEDLAVQMFGDEWYVLEDGVAGAGTDALESSLLDGLPA